MKREFLKSLGIEAEAIDKIMEEHGTGINKAKAEVENLKQKQADLQEELKTANSTLEGLKEANKDNEGLQAELESYKAKIDTIQSESAEKVKGLLVKNALTKALSKADEKYHGLLEKAFDLSNVEVLEDGTLKGFDEQVTQVTETYSDLFVGDKPSGATPANKTKPTGGNGQPTTSDFMSAIYDAQVKR